MFVNISPSVYNRQETTMSLFYGARVQVIKNDPKKVVEGKETTKLRGMLEQAEVERDKFRVMLERQGLLHAEESPRDSS